MYTSLNKLIIHIKKMKSFLLFIVWILSILWWYFSWRYLNIANLDSLTIIILLSWIFVFWILFGKIHLLSEKKLYKNTKQNKILNPTKCITKVEPLTQDKKSNFLANNDNSNSTNDFSSFKDISDNTFLNISNNLKKEKKQDLKIIEWIGPKIEELLNKWWIYSYSDLKNSPNTTIQNILDKAGKRYAMHNPSTWKKQASFANRWNFKKLESYQNILVKGVEI